MRNLIRRMIRPYQVIAEQNRRHDALWLDLDATRDALAAARKDVEQRDGWLAAARKERDEAKKQADDLAGNLVARDEEVVRLHSEVAEARRERDEVRKDMAVVGRTCDRLQADRDTAVKSAAAFHVDNGRLRDRLAAIRDAASKPID